MQLGEVVKNYDRAARYYDRLTDLAFGWILGIEKYRERAVELLGELDGRAVLDVGCGTGRSFPLLAPRVGKRGRIVGVDYSQGMLLRARQRIERAGWRNVELVRGDAVRLETVSGPFDAVISIWCYGIVHDLEAALNRAVDLLRPGGAIAIVDFERSRPEHGLLRWLYPLYSRVLERTGIDSAEDMDSARLAAKWQRGRQVLRRRLHSLDEQSYLQGTGVILTGHKPE